MVMMSEMVDSNTKEKKADNPPFAVNRRSCLTLGLSLGIPVLFVIVIIYLLIGLQNRAETAAADLVSLLPVGYAFGAGMVASVNPCGFFMLPAYISFQLGTQEPAFYNTPASRRLFKALALGIVTTLGFMMVFAITGVLIAAGGQWLIQVFPYAGVVMGGALVTLGIWLLLSGRTLGIPGAGQVRIAPRRNLGNGFLFGIVYAISSLSCTLPIFLIVVGSSLVGQSLVASLGQFVAFALGMGTILVMVTIGSAVFQGSIARWLRRAIPYVYRASAIFLVGAGAYLIYYWVFFVGLTF
jgi:cytochrome c-type biogenesis protein